MGVLRKLLVLSFTIFFVVEPVAEEVCHFFVVNKLPYTKSIRVRVLPGEPSFWSPLGWKTVAEINLFSNECVEVSSIIDEIEIHYESSGDVYAKRKEICPEYISDSYIFFLDEVDQRELTLITRRSVHPPDCSALMTIDRKGKVDWRTP